MNVPRDQERNRQSFGAVTLSELALAAGLIGLDVVARLIPHVSNFSPLMATALLGGVIFRARPLALLVPLAAMALGDCFVGFYDWRVMAVVYASLCVPAMIGVLARGTRLIVTVPPVALASSLVFFTATNFAVWAFSGMYPHDETGLIACYLAGLPFLKNAIVGDLVWTGLLFGALALVRRFSAGGAAARPQPAA